MNYKLLRGALFTLNPEVSHNLTLKLLNFLYSQGLLPKLFPPCTNENLTKTVFGLKFANPVGLAAGLDKNGDYIDALGALGFGFIEIGTITPQPQPGNPKPRLFRLVKEQAIINRMGMNNKGVDYLVERVKARKYTGILGINIGKNANTPLENAVDDYLICMRKVYPYASYITVNISSPNTPGLRKLQGSQYFNELLSTLKKEQLNLQQTHNRTVPLLIKIAPDLEDHEIKEMAQSLVEHQIDGVIATNTTIDRSTISQSKYAEEAGGLSGAPLFEHSTNILRKLKSAMGEYSIPIIGCGGIINAEQAETTMAAGADLIQIYSGLVYQGPRLIAEIKHVISER